MSEYSQVGRLVKIKEPSGRLTYEGEEISIVVDGGRISLSIYGEPLQNDVFGSVKIGNSFPANEAQLDAAVAAVFPNADSAAKQYADAGDVATLASAKSIKSATDDNGAYSTLTNSQWGVFGITGQDPTLYAKDSTGNKFKLTLPAL